MKPINLFVAFAPEDAEYRDKMGKHLSTLRERGFINEFCISEITPGSDSDLSIRTLMNQAKIILLLISADFLASDSCRRFEDLAFSMQMRNDAIVIPVLLRSCLYDESYNKLQILPDNKKPISDKLAWGNEDAAFTNVTERIKQLVVKLRAQGQPETKISEPVIPPNKTSKRKIPIVPIVAIIGLLVVLLIWQPWTDSSNSSSDRQVNPPVSERVPPNREETIEEATPIEEPKPAPEKIIMPPLKGISLSEALSRLRDMGVAAGQIQQEVKVYCDQRPGIVLDQRPVSGQEYQPGASVKLQVTGEPRPINPPSIGRQGDQKILSNGGRYSSNAWALKNTVVLFSLGGTECSTGKIEISHALAGTETINLKAGQQHKIEKFFGAGSIGVRFTGNDSAAKLRVTIY
jgi:hypothetical protein